MNRVEDILAQVNKVIIGKNDTVAAMLAGILSAGHILIEDVPGTGKTTLSRVMARVLGCTFSRIQFTPDLMPSDIIGLSIYDRSREQFVFKPGPVMSQFLLADEINRTSPKTQAALLEAMAEKQVTVDGVTHPLPEPFIVAATQNPIEYEGTYPLPEAQLDRFMMRLKLGYAEESEEMKIIALDHEESSFDTVREVITSAELLEMRGEVKKVHMAETLHGYITRLTRATRDHADILLGVSARGGQYLYRVSKGVAFVRGRDYVLPDDIKDMVGAVFSHRLLLKPEARLKGKDETHVLEEILHQTFLPVNIEDRI